MPLKPPSSPKHRITSAKIKGKQPQRSKKCLRPGPSTVDGSDNESPQPPLPPQQREPLRAKPSIQKVLVFHCSCVALSTYSFLGRQIYFSCRYIILFKILLN